jgi:deoxyribonuclease V
MIVAVDVHYRPDVAKAVGVLFESWTASEPHQIVETFVKEVAEYEPGAFYKRELPCILQVLETIPQYSLEAIIIDGYVFLDDEGKRGLGAYLYEALGQRIPVVGFAKSSFHKNQKFVRQIFRSESKKPVFITSIGIPVDEAAQNIESMLGDYRIPDMLRITDQKTRENKSD